MATKASEKIERLNLRLDTHAKAQLQKAAAFEGKTVSGFVVASALEKAQRTIDAHETMALSRADAETFLDAILDPPAPAKKLKQAMKAHRRRVSAQ